MDHASAPVPTAELAAYVGDRYADDPVYSYLGAGSSIRQALELLLADHDWSWEGKRVLDFGCGSGRVLRHFLPEATSGTAEFVGADIHEPSVRWLNDHLGPALHAEVVDEQPPLPFADASFDLIWSTSVFTHLTDHWAGWLAELHRVLKPGGILIVTVLSRCYAPVLTERPWDPDRTGMLVLGYGAPWDAGGPMVMHSEWWVRAHWGRAFDVLAFQDGGFATTPDLGQGSVVMSRRDVDGVDAEMLEALEPDEPREIAALQAALEQTQWERADLNRKHDAFAYACADLREQLATIESSPRLALRNAAGALRRRLDPRRPSS